MSIVHTEAQTLTLGLRVDEFIDDLARFNEIARDWPDKLEKVILAEAFRHPKWDILVTAGELAVRLEFSDFTCFKLIDETGICRPKLTNIIDFKKFHCPSFKAKPESPPNFFLNISLTWGHHFIMNHTTPQNLKPFIIIVDFQLKGRVSEWERIRWPFHLYIPKNLPCQVGQHLLQIFSSHMLSIFHISDTNFIIAEDSNAFHLMEHWVVRLINGVLSVYVPHTQETLMPLLQQRDLVDTSMCSE